MANAHNKSFIVEDFNTSFITDELHNAIKAYAKLANMGNNEDPVKMTLLQVLKQNVTIFMKKNQLTTLPKQLLGLFRDGILTNKNRLTNNVEFYLIGIGMAIDENTMDDDKDISYTSGSTFATPARKSTRRPVVYGTHAINADFNVTPKSTTTPQSNTTPSTIDTTAAAIPATSTIGGETKTNQNSTSLTSFIRKRSGRKTIIAQTTTLALDSKTLVEWKLRQVRKAIMDLITSEHIPETSEQYKSKLDHISKLMLQYKVYPTSNPKESILGSPLITSVLTNPTTSHNLFTDNSISDILELPIMKLGKGHSVISTSSTDILQNSGLEISYVFLQWLNSFILPNEIVSYFLPKARQTFSTGNSSSWDDIETSNTLDKTIKNQYQKRNIYSKLKQGTNKSKTLKQNLATVMSNEITILNDNLAIHGILTTDLEDKFSSQANSLSKLTKDIATQGAKGLNFVDPFTKTLVSITVPTSTITETPVFDMILADLPTVVKESEDVFTATVIVVNKNGDETKTTTSQSYSTNTLGINYVKSVHKTASKAMAHIDVLKAELQAQADHIQNLEHALTNSLEISAAFEADATEHIDAVTQSANEKQAEYQVLQRIVTGVSLVPDSPSEFRVKVATDRMKLMMDLGDKNFNKNLYYKLCKLDSSTIRQREKTSHNNVSSSFDTYYIDGKRYDVITNNALLECIGGTAGVNFNHEGASASDAVNAASHDETKTTTGTGTSTAKVAKRNKTTTTGTGKSTEINALQLENEQLVESFNKRTKEFNTYRSQNVKITGPTGLVTLARFAVGSETTYHRNLHKKTCNKQDLYKSKFGFDTGDVAGMNVSNILVAGIQDQYPNACTFTDKNGNTQSHPTKIIRNMGADLLVQLILECENMSRSQKLAFKNKFHQQANNNK